MKSKWGRIDVEKSSKRDHIDVETRLKWGRVSYQGRNDVETISKWGRNKLNEFETRS